MRATRSRKSGFTLIELLACIAIIAVLAGILIPVVGNVRSSAHETACRSNLRQLGLAIHNYSTESGFYPPSISGGSQPEMGGAPKGQIWTYYLRPYFEAQSDDFDAAFNSEVLVCPTAEINPEGKNISSYSANPAIMPDLGSNTAQGSAVRVSLIYRPSEVILLGDAIQRDPQGAHSNFWLVPEMTGSDNTSWGDPANRDTPIGLGSDTDGISEAQFRYRHGGAANVVFVDAHVDSFEKGDILRKHVRKNY